MMRGFLSPRHSASSGCGRRNSLEYGGQLAIYLISSRGQPTAGGPPSQKKYMLRNYENCLGLGMRWAGNLARIGDRRGAYRVLVGKPGGKRILGKRGVDGKIILKCIFGKWEGAWSGLLWLRIGKGGGLL